MRELDLAHRLMMATLSWSLAQEERERAARAADALDLGRAIWISETPFEPAVRRLAALARDGYDAAARAAVLQVLDAVIMALGRPIRSLGRGAARADGRDPGESDSLRAEGRRNNRPSPDGLRPTGRRASDAERGADSASGEISVNRPDRADAWRNRADLA